MEKPVVIVKESKMQAPVTHLLEVSFKIRAGKIAPDYIFPSFSCAFMILDSTSINKDDFGSKIEELKKGFKRCFVLTLCGLTDFLKVQASIKDGNPKLVPVMDATNAFHFMIDIIELTVQNDNNGDNNNNNNNDNNVVHEDDIVEALCRIPGLKRHDCLVLCQGLGSLGNIAVANQQLITSTTSLSQEKAKSIINFFTL